MSRFDTRTTTFSPEGRLFQVEYAGEAINNAGVTIGILTTEGIVLAADKAAASKMLEPDKEKEKIYVVDQHIISAVAGWTADANVLLNHSRLQAQRHLFKFDEPVPVEQLVTEICDIKQSYTQFGGLRPFGVSFLVAGWDVHKGYQLYHTDPAGNFGGWKTTAVGENSVSAQSILKEEWNENLTLSQGLLLAAKVLVKTTDATPDNADKLEFAVLTVKDVIGAEPGAEKKATNRFLSDPEVANLLTRASEDQTAP